MPTYDYRCDESGEIFEVKHRMSESLSTWRELCEYADLDPGKIPLGSSVTRLATGGQVVKSSSLGEHRDPACGAGGCGRSMCSLS